LDGRNPEEPLKITVLVDGLPVAEALAIYHRPDVGEAFGCRGLNGFYVDLAKCCSPGKGVSVEVALPDSRLITEKPMIADVPVRLRNHEAAVLLMHIAKTGGTSLREAIAGNYLVSEVAYLYPHPPGIPGGDLRRLPLEQRARLRCVIGHFRYGIHKYLPSPSRYVTQVRDPVRRVISHYTHLASLSAEAITRGGQLLSICDAVERRITCDLDNLMVRHFAGVDDLEFPPGSVSERHYYEAVRNIESDFLFIGHQEDSQLCFEQLAALCGWRATELGHSMVGGRPSALFGDPERIATTIRECNAWDARLYDDIVRRFPRAGVVRSVPASGRWADSASAAQSA
jgi:hypothetical protein